MTQGPSLSFFARLWLAFLCFWRVLFSRAFAGAVAPLSRAYDAGTLGPPAPPGAPPASRPQPDGGAPERAQAPALHLLSLLQREGRLLDFLQEDVAAFSDTEVGAAARVVHEGCRRVLRQYVDVEPALRDSEGARVQVQDGFDAQRIRLTGNVAGAPPFSGTLKHHGWVASAVRLPSPSAAVDPRVLAPAEVELA